MSADSLKCSFCGGTMRRVKVLPIKLVGSNRFTCACGHIEVTKAEPAAKPLRNAGAAFPDKLHS